MINSEFSQETILAIEEAWERLNRIRSILFTIHGLQVEQPELNLSYTVATVLNAGAESLSQLSGKLIYERGADIK